MGAVASLLAVALADQSSHQVIKHGNAPSVSHSVHKPHGSHHAVVASQPHAAPQAVHNPYSAEKYSAAVHAPAHIPVHKPAPYHAPVVHKPAPYVAPVVHKPAPYHAPAPVVHKPAPYVAPVVHKPIAHPAPAYHKPAPYHEPAYEGPAVYEYGYAVQDDYSKAAFSASENRNGDATTGSYSVALPDGRTQHVKYTVDAYGGYVADVSYEGVAQYPEYKPAPYHPAPKPAYHPAPIHA